MSSKMKFTVNLFRLDDDGTKSNELYQCLKSNFLKKIFHIFPVSKPTVSLCVMYEVKLGWKWCTPRFQRTRRRESLSTDQVRYKNKINQCMGEQLWLWPRPQLLYGLVWHTRWHPPSEVWWWSWVNNWTMRHNLWKYRLTQ